MSQPTVADAQAIAAKLLPDGYSGDILRQLEVAHGYIHANTIYEYPKAERLQQGRDILINKLIQNPAILSIYFQWLNAGYLNNLEEIDAIDTRSGVKIVGRVSLIRPILNSGLIQNVERMLMLEKTLSRVSSKDHHIIEQMSNLELNFLSKQNKDTVKLIIQEDLVIQQIKQTIKSSWNSFGIERKLKAIDDAVAAVKIKRIETEKFVSLLDDPAIRKACMTTRPVFGKEKQSENTNSFRLLKAEMQKLKSESNAAGLQPENESINRSKNQ